MSLKDIDPTLAVDNFYDTIVIGSGIGGMTAAAFLAKCGLQRVLVLEQHPTTCGGCTHEFERKNMEFDTGIHYVGGDMWNPNSTMRRVFDFVTEGKVSWMKMDHAFDLTTVDGVKYEIRSGFNQQRMYLKQRFPAQPVDAYFDDVDKTASRYSKFLLANVADAYLPRAIVERTLLDTSFGEETLAQAMDRVGITEAVLRKVLSYNYGDYGFEPSRSSYVQHCMTVVHYANGSSYPSNGPHVIADAVQEMLERHGGKMLPGVSVQSVFIENGEAKGVVIKGIAKPIRAKTVISAAGAFNTFCKLIPENASVPNAEMLAKARAAFQTKNLEPSPAFAMVFAAFQGTGEELGLPGANLWVQDSADFPYVFLSFPSVRDPSWKARHPDRTVCEVIVEANYDDFSGLAEEEYQRRKRALAEKMLAEAYREFPRLKGRLLFQVSSTPRTAEKFLGSQKGCSYGVAPTPARFRANREWMKPRTPVPNLYLGGQDVVSCGMCGGMFGGMLAACVVNAKCLFKARELLFPLPKPKL